MLIATTNDLPGFEIKRMLGEVFGLTVRSRNAFSNIGASFKALGGGELKGLTKVLYESRNEVMGRMIYEAQARGANAIVAMRFDTSEMGPAWTEICAYGTAIYAVPITDEAKQTMAWMGQQQQPQQQAYAAQPGYQPTQGQPQPAAPQGTWPAN